MKEVCDYCEEHIRNCWCGGGDDRDENDKLSIKENEVDFRK